MAGFSSPYAQISSYGQKQPSKTDPYSSDPLPIGEGGFGTYNTSSGATNFDVESPYGQASRSPVTAGGANATASTNSKSTGADYTVDQYGNTVYSNQTASQNNAARLQAEAEARRQAALMGLWGQTGGASAPHVSYGGAGGAEEAARAAAFARAKDQSGKLAMSGLRSVQENMSGRGISGSGIQDLQDAGVLQGAQTPLQELTRDQLMMDLNRSADISDMTYQGDITQRGQTLAAQQQQIQQLLGLFSTRY
jgi:hypothetical protein